MCDWHKSIEFKCQAYKKNLSLINMLGCNIVISKLKLLSHYYVHFWANTLSKVINPFKLAHNQS